MTDTAIKGLRKEVKKKIDAADERMLKVIDAMLEADMQGSHEEETGWWNNISDEERASMEEGIRQLENGEGIPHAEVMKKYSKWLTK